MYRVKAKLVLSAGLGSLAGVALASGQVASAKDALLACMQNGSRVNVVAIIMQRDPGVKDGFQCVKMLRSRDGKSKHTILQPLRAQGTESVDDGETFLVYLPNDSVVIRRESAGSSTSDLAQRIELATKNYNFRFDARTKVADRNALCVIATPKYRGIDTRRFFIDEEQLFPLRLETQSKSMTRTIYDTKYIDFPKTISQSTFKLSVHRDVKEYRYARPQNCQTKEEASMLVGFSPMMPKSLPYGFQMQDVQVEMAATTKKVMLQITDGLAKATVFQWKSTGSENRMKATEDFSVGERNGIRIMIVSDIEEKIRAKLLEAFLKQMTQIPEPQAKVIGSLKLGPTIHRELSLPLIGCVS